MFNHYNYFDNNNVRDTRFYVAMQGLSKGNMSQDLYDNFGKYVPRELPYTEENAFRAYSFAIVDLGLYLDTHPNEANVKILYDQYVSKYNEILKNMQAKNKMINTTTPNTDKLWTWSATLPWEVKN